MENEQASQHSFRLTLIFLLQQQTNLQEENLMLIFALLMSFSMMIVTVVAIIRETSRFDEGQACKIATPFKPGSRPYIRFI